MTRAVLLVIAAVLVIALPALIAGDDHHDLGSGRRVQSTTDTTPTTTWLETQPDLGHQFNEYRAGVARAEKAKRDTGRRRLFRSAMVQPSARSGYSCGGDLPPCYVLERESLMADDPPRVWNGNCYMPTGSLGQCGASTASGLWQFLRSTWNNFGGYINAADAPVDVQNAKARQLWAGGRGCSHWAAC